MAKALMVGFSTAQNIINILPAIQMNADAFMFIETELAKDKKWADGSLKVLKSRGIEIIDAFSITNKDNSNVISIVCELVADLQEFETVIFNLGGGQKMHSIALWECFAARGTNFKNDSACYIDQTTKKINVFRFVDGSVQTTEIDINSKLNAIDIFEIFGFEVTDLGTIFFEKDKKNEITSLDDYTKYPDFRAYTTQSFKVTENVKEENFTLSEVKAMFGSEKGNTLKAKIENSITSLKTKENTVFINKKQYDEQFYACILKTIRDQILVTNLTFGNEFEFKDEALIKLFGNKTSICNTRTLGAVLSSTFGIYFEKVLVQRIFSILNQNNHTITSAFSNLKIQRGNDHAEYDIVLLTNQGTLIVLDAKTDDFSKKDEDARNHNLLASAGAYAKFIPVYLFYPEDINKSDLSQAIKVKIKDSSINRKPYLTFNTELNNIDVKIENIKLKLNPINDILNIFKLN